MSSLQDHLFTLIKSLTPHEKGYIRRMAALHKQTDENNYLRLFDALDRQKEYDEAALRKKLAKEKFMRNLSGAKNYLAQVILRHLESYDTSPQNEVRSLLSQYSILRGKGLHAMAYRLLHRAWKCCMDAELDFQKTEILFLLLSHHITFPVDTEWPGGTEALLEDIRSLSRINTEASEMRVELDQLRRQAPGMMQSRSEEQSKKFISRARELQRFDVSRFPSFDTRYQYYQLLTNYFYFAGEIGEGLKCADAMCGWMLQNESYMNVKGSTFVTAFYNKALYELMSYRDSFYVTMKQLEHVVNECRDKNPASVVLLRRLQLLEAWEKCRYDDVHEMAEKNIRFLQRNKTTIQYFTEDLLLRLINASAFFAEQKFSEAAKELRRLLRDPNESKVPSVGSTARLLLLIVEFESGDHNGLDATLRSVYRFLSHKKLLLKTEKAILDFLRFALRDLHSKNEMHSAFIKLREKMREASAGKNDEITARIFDPEAWLDSKISQVSFAESRAILVKKRWNS